MKLVPLYKELRSLQGNTFKGKHYRELRQHIERMASTSTLPPAEQQAQVISYLIENRYVDDERFARLFIQDKIRFNRWGPKKIEQALWMKHVDERVYREQLEAVSDEQWQEALQPLLESKRKSIHASSPYEQRAKLIRYAMGRGFTMDQIQQCLSCDE